MSTGILSTPDGPHACARNEDPAATWAGPGTLWCVPLADPSAPPARWTGPTDGYTLLD